MDCKIYSSSSSIIYRALLVCSTPTSAKRYTQQILFIRVLETSARGSWLRQKSCQCALTIVRAPYRLGSAVEEHDAHKASKRRQHARLAYVMRVEYRASVAFAAASFCPGPRFKKF